MIFVLVTTKSDAELAKLAPIVARNISEGGHGWDGGTCFVRSDAVPIVIEDQNMLSIQKTMIFIFGLEMEHQGKRLELANKITQETGCKTSILS